jgi:hypothetical protein
MGRDYLQNELGLPAANAINEGERLAAIVKEALLRSARNGSP